MSSTRTATRSVAVLVCALVVAAIPSFGSAGPIQDLVGLLPPLPIVSPLLPGAAGPGTVQPTPGVDPDCPSGQTCRGFEIACPGLQEEARGYIAVGNAIGSPRGVLVTFNGGIGRDYEFATGGGADWLQQIRSDGFTTVQVRWLDPWLYAAPGENAGTHALACRSASVITWIHDTVFVPMNVPALGAGRCGFCLTGNSGGASQISYAISRYGLEGIVDGIFPTSGPPHAAMTKACRGMTSESGYWFPPDKAELIDRARGFFANDGPCLNRVASYSSAWQTEAVDTGGTDYTHPATRVHFFLGGADDGYILAHAQDYANRLKEAGSPMVTVQIFANMGHAPSAQALAALRSALLQ